MTCAAVDLLPGLQLGECIGRGAAGAVFLGLNLGTGQTVAVKQLSRPGPATRTDEIMLEIDLLKQLRHPNIVTLFGYVESGSALHIIMEFCENGSLREMLRKFGNIPESLAAVYVSQVLNGLAYLHAQGVIHRDIKSANILSTKDGTVKLADFGIAVRQNLADENVAGSAYWMAPEVIELRGACTASDIWSVGCTSIELVTGQPPYGDLAPVSALFRIVSDDHPPIPSDASAMLSSFLAECFQRDPHLRISASNLCDHPWLNRKKANNFHAIKEPSSSQNHPETDLSQMHALQRLEIYAESEDNASSLGDAFEAFSGPLHLATRSQTIRNLDGAEDPEADLFADVGIVPLESSPSKLDELWDEKIDHEFVVGELSSSTQTQALRGRLRQLLVQNRLTTLMHTIRRCSSRSSARFVIISEINAVLSLAVPRLNQASVHHSAQLICFLVSQLSGSDFRPFLRDHPCTLEFARTVGLLLEFSPATVIISCQQLLRILLRRQYPVPSVLLSHIWSALKSQTGERRHELHQALVDAKLLQPILKVARTCLVAVDNHLSGTARQALMVLQDISQTERLRSRIGTEFVFREVTCILSHADSDSLILALKIIKNLCQAPELSNNIGKGELIYSLCDVLWRQNNRGSGEIQSQVLLSLSHLTKMTVKWQEEAIKAGLAGHLAAITLSGSTARQFAIPLLCVLARGGKLCRDALWNSGAPAVLVSLIAKDQVWRSTALEAIIAWLQDEPMRLEHFLLSNDVISAVPPILSSMTAADEQLAEGVMQLVATSTAITNRLVNSGLVSAVGEALGRMPSMQMTVCLLKILDHVCSRDENGKTCQPSAKTPTSTSFSNIGRRERSMLLDVVQKCAKSRSLLAQQLARRVESRLQADAQMSLHVKT